MKVLFVTNSAHLPQQMGGGEVSAHELIKGLRSKNVDARLISALGANGWTYYINRLKSIISNKHYPSDKTLGYEVYRGWVNEWGIDQGVDEIISQGWSPDVFIVTGKKPFGAAKSLRRFGVKIILKLVDVEEDNYLDLDSSASEYIYVANSNFTAKSVRSQYGVEVHYVVPPYIDYSRFSKSKLGTGQYVTLINPHPLKGGFVLLEIAKRNPTIPFLVVESWPLMPSYKASFLEEVKKLGNIKYIDATMNMDAVFRDTRVLLVPSQYEEAWGRVINEAQYNGVPVIASSQGGMPEAVGNAGIVVQVKDNIDQWNFELQKLLSDDVLYQKLSCAGRQRVTRDDLNPDRLISDWISILYAH